MKNALALAGLLALVAVPAFAEDGAVPRATLVSLGLGDLQRISDAQGMQVRGQASFFSRVRGTTVVFGQFYDPATDTTVPVGPFTSTVDVQSTTTGILNGLHSVPFSASVTITVVSPPSTFSGTMSGTVRGFGTLSVFHP